jgi:hypothetical protein
LPVLNNSSLGQHFRHILNFYQSVIRGAETRLIDYALRERDSLVETDPAFAQRAFKGIEIVLHRLQEDQPLQVLADFVPEPGAERPIVASSVGRELMYAYDHALHHLAIIKIGLREVFPEVLVESHIGVAPSTIKYQSAHPNQQATEKRNA